jgi:hypothetical protein
VSTRIRQCLTVIGVVCLVLSISFALATPFLPLSPFWQQAAVGFALVGLQMSIWLGPAMASRIARLRQEMLRKAVNTNRQPSAQNGIYFEKVQPVTVVNAENRQGK